MLEFPYGLVMWALSDRCWWLQRVVGIVLTIGSFIAAIYELIQAHDAYNVAQIASSGPLDTALLRDLAALLRNQAQEILLLGLAYVVFVVQGILLILKSFDAQRRLRRRLCAIEGDQEAMPLARIKVDASEAPELSSESLELLWRATPYRGRIMTRLYTSIIVVFAPFVMLCLYLAYCLATNTLPFGSGHLEPISPLERVGLLAVLLVVTALLLFLIMFIVSNFPSERGRPYGVAASNDGLWYYPPVGKRRLLLWEEIRLLEVSKKGDREYKLYDGNTFARWLEQPPSYWVSVGMSKEEFEQRHQALLNLVAARTHLLPRTFDKQ